MKKESTEQRESTSLKIRPSIWKLAKHQAINHDKQLSELVEDAIEEWIERHKK
jgi:hypothetical protein